MPITAIYFIPASQPASVLAELTDRLVRAYDPVQLGSWFLHHRLFRSLPASTTDKSPPHSQHVLGVGHHPNRAFVHIAGPAAQPQPQLDAPPPDSATTVAIPLAQMEPYSNLLNLKFGALWIYRFGSQVTNGVSYSLGEFTVRMGEVREKGGQLPPRGVVVCLQAAKQDPGDDAGAGDVADAGDAQQELQAGQALLRDLWASFGPQGAKEAITSRVPGPADDDVFSEVQLWCEVLRFQK